jgi:hypothetical protein
MHVLTYRLSEPASEQQVGRSPAPAMLAVALLAASVVLHAIAMVPRYYGGPGEGSLWSQPDQAAQYALLTGGWALALVLTLTGSARARIGAALAAGIAVTEFGLLLSNLGEVFRYGSGQGSVGLWLMTAAWVVGSAGATLALLSTRRRRLISAGPDVSGEPVTTGRDLTGTDLTGPDLTSPDLTRPDLIRSDPGNADPTWRDRTRSDLTIADPTWPDQTRALGGPEDATGQLPPGPPPEAAAIRTGSDGALRGRPAFLVILLAVATAGAFLPAWDHYVATSTTGGSVSLNLGNAFSGPWQVVIGNVLLPLAVLAAAVVAVRAGHRAVGTALLAGSLLVLASQFTAAVVQVDHPLPAAVAGVSPAQASQLRMSLTGWFTFDILAAFALLVAAVAFGHARTVGPDPTPQATWPPVPEGHRAPSLPWP